MEPETVYVGIDVSKTCVDVAVRPTGQMWTISNDEPGIREPVSRLKALDPAMVVLESTGGLELPSVAALAAAALPVAIVNPRQVRDFARATGTLAKTDAVRPVVRPLKDAETQVLSSPVARRHPASLRSSPTNAFDRSRGVPMTTGFRSSTGILANTSSPCSGFNGSFIDHGASLPTSFRPRLSTDPGFAGVYTGLTLTPIRLGFCRPTSPV